MSNKPELGLTDSLPLTNEPIITSTGPSLLDMTRRNLVNFQSGSGSGGSGSGGSGSDSGGSGSDTLDWLRNRYAEDDEKTAEIEQQIADEAAKNSDIAVRIGHLNDVVKK